MEQLSLFQYVEVSLNLYDNQIEYVYNALKESLFRKEIPYTTNERVLKEWFCKKFFRREDLDEISGEDLLYIAIEKCNMILN